MYLGREAGQHAFLSHGGSFRRKYVTDLSVEYIFYVGGIPLDLGMTIAFCFSLVWEVHFHPTNPDHLFTCSEDGSLLHWETCSGSDAPSFLQGKKESVAGLICKGWECFPSLRGAILGIIKPF